MDIATILIMIAAVIVRIFFFGYVTYSIMEKNGYNKKGGFFWERFAACGVR